MASASVAGRRSGCCGCRDAGRLGRWYRTSLIALPLLAVTVLNADEFQMGLLAAFETLAFLIVGLPAGAWVDRMRKRNVLVVGDLVRGCCCSPCPRPACWTC